MYSLPILVDICINGCLCRSFNPRNTYIARNRILLNRHFNFIYDIYLFIYILKPSFNRAQQWVKELIQQANSQIVICLVGNKADMASESRSVTKEVGCFTSLNCNSKNIADLNRPTGKGNKHI